MRQINIKELRANLSAELNNLPFVITRKGEIIAEVGVHLKTKAVKKTESQPYCDIIGVHRIETIKEKLTEIINKKKSVHQDKADIPKVVTTPKKKKKGSHNVAERVAAVMVKDLLKNGTYIHPEETPWVNPLSNTVLAPKK